MTNVLFAADQFGSLDAGGCRTTSANCIMDGSLGSIGGISTASSPPEAIKSGFIGQLYDPAGFTINASPTNVNEGTSRQLTAAQIMDDDTFLALAGSDVGWDVVSGPIASISLAALATATNVYQDTAATVRGTYGNLSNDLALLVVNVTSDDFGVYAGDGIDDDWQVSYFGEENPEAAPGEDPDRDGRDNLFESLALTIPTDHSSYFKLQARPAPGQPGSVDLVFSPVRTERTYTVLYSLDLSPSNWNELAGATQTNNGEERTVTDPDTAPTRKFYNVRISR
ncbi:MAG TPA: hypothetical protein PLU30_24265 [Verrucomicrobiae bacterium]|nr:hypothetical protein [Verrucomicrobiae bacterium]